MRYINWALVAAGLFLTGFIMSIVSMFVGDAARFIVWVIGAMLIVVGWITLGIAHFKR